MVAVEFVAFVLAALTIIGVALLSAFLIHAAPFIDGVAKDRAVWRVYAVAAFCIVIRMLPLAGVRL